MKPSHHPLVTAIFVVGAVIAAFSYLFHPDVGVFTMMVNGQPVNSAFLPLAALPGALLVFLVSGLLAVLLFWGVGLVLFLAALLFALLVIFLVAPFFWPVLVVVFLMFALMAPRGS